MSTTSVRLPPDKSKGKMRMCLGIKRIIITLSALILSASSLISPVFGATNAQKKTEKTINGKVLSDAYIEFIKSKDAISYLIYDIDKDDYPEVFVERHDQENRALVFDIYTFKEGAFEMLGTEYGPGGHVSPVFASYPDSNGVLEYSVHKGKELIQLHKWVEGNHSVETVYLEDASGKYYRDSNDQTYKESYSHKRFINHQFYKSENSSPLYKESLLLAQSSPADFSAVYEAFNGSGKGSDKSKDDSKEQDLDEITIKTLKSYIGKHRSEIPYDTSSEITSEVWHSENCYETVKNPKMYGHEGKVLFEFEDDVVINTFWTSGAVQYDEINLIIQDIRETTGLKEQELYEDQLYWADTSDYVEYYIKYHEAPLIIGTKQMSEQKEGADIKKDAEDYNTLLTMYSTAIAEKWDKGRLGSENFNYQLLDLGEIGYIIKDLNNDSVPELMIGPQNPPYEAFQNSVLDMYTLDNGKPKQIFSGTEKVFGYLSDNGILKVVKHGGAEATLYQYNFLDPSKLEFYTKKSVCYDGFYDSDHPWFSDFSHSVSYTEEQAKSIMASYPIHSIDYVSIASYE